MRWGAFTMLYTRWGFTPFCKSVPCSLQKRHGFPLGCLRSASQRLAARLSDFLGTVLWWASLPAGVSFSLRLFYAKVWGIESFLNRLVYVLWRVGAFCATCAKTVEAFAVTSSCETRSLPLTSAMLLVQRAGPHWFLRCICSQHSDRLPECTTGCKSMELIVE